jgi:hypothetical protein
MSRFRLAFTSLLFASTLAAGCVGTARTPGPTGPRTPEKVVVVPNKQVDRAAVRAKLAERRKVMFDRFIAYRDAAVYPINDLPEGGFRHVWIDVNGNLCAAATLISGDWGHESSAAVGRENLEIKVADVKTGPLMDWILMSGFTKHELVAIQVPGFTDPQFEQRQMEVARLFSIYQDVERQLTGLWEENLDEATDALVAHPDLARQLLGGTIAGPGKYGVAAAAAVATAG